MSYSITIGVDLAKNVIQVSVVSERGKEVLNRSLTRRFGKFDLERTRSNTGVLRKSTYSCPCWIWHAL